jgi:cytochrome P450
MREQSPIGRSEKHGGFWVVSGFEEAFSVIHRPAEFSSYPVILPAFPEAVAMIPIEMDPPVHQTYRSLIGAAFSPKTASAYADDIRSLVNRLIDEIIEVGEADACEALARPLPVLITTRILGLPDSDSHLFLRWTDTIVHESATNPALAGQAVNELYEYTEKLLRKRRADPSGSDVMSILVRSKIDGQKLTDDELKGFSLLLILAGIDTTQKSIGSIIWYLAENPDIRRSLIERPDLVAPAVEELLRLFSPVQVARTVTTDTEVGGCLMKAGDRLLVLLASANRDEREFENSEQFTPERSPNRHLAFGGHAHRCLGSHIARVELRVLLQEYLRRIPEYSVADPSKVEWAAGHAQGIVRLPIRFSPGKRETPRFAQDIATPNARNGSGL